MIKSVLIIVMSVFFLLSCSSKKLNSFKDEQKKDPVQSSLSKAAASVEKKFTIPSCSGDNCCVKNKNCIKQCDGLFPEMEKKQKCLGFPIQLVADMFQTLNKYLRNPSRETLKKIDPFLLWSVIRVSEKLWLKKIKNYSKTQARETLFWLASNPTISESVFMQFPRKEPINILLIALFRQSAHSSLVDDNALLFSFKEPLSDKEDSHFFKVIEQNVNRSLFSLVHEEIVHRHICEYSINWPVPTYVSDRTYEACILSAYCYFTGSYTDNRYISFKQEERGQGQKLRKWMAGKINNERINSFIQDLQIHGGLELAQAEANKWSDKACQKLAELWDDGNIQFGL